MSWELWEHIVRPRILTGSTESLSWAEDDKRFVKVRCGQDMFPVEGATSERKEV